MILAADGLTLQAGGRTLVRDLDLRFGAGEFWAVLGPNGAGKTLLLETLAGLRRPAAGSVTLDARPLAAWPRAELAARLAMLLQDEPHEYWGTLGDYVELGRLPHASADDAAAVRAALAALELEPIARQPYRTLSGGERQRARIAQCLAQAGDVLLLDEPLNHLDLRHQAAVLERLGALARAGKTLVASLHAPGWVLTGCSHAVLMYHSGRVAQGVAAEVVTHSNAAALYDVPLDAIARMVPTGRVAVASIPTDSEPR